MTALFHFYFDKEKEVEYLHFVGHIGATVVVPFKGYDGPSLFLFQRRSRVPPTSLYGAH